LKQDWDVFGAKRGRPATGRVKKNVLGSRFSDKEIKKIKTLAKENGMPQNEFIMSLVDACLTDTIF
jgi:hypothetical protein